MIQRVQSSKNIRVKVPAILTALNIILMILMALLFYN